MSELETITLSRSKRDVFVGKVILILVVGCVAGYFFGLDKAADLAEAQQLTLEEYTGLFEHYKADLSKGPDSAAAGIVMMVTVAFLFAAVYELLGRLFGAVVGRVISRRE